MKKIITLSLALLLANLTFSQWIEQNPNSFQTFTDVHFVNNLTGFACGSIGTLLGTTNGGNSWQDIDVGVNSSFLSVHAINTDIIFVARNGIYKTIDGINFIEVGGLSSVTNSIFDIEFLDPNNGFIIKGSLILKTTDGGNNWTTAYNSNGFIDNIQFTDLSTGYASGGISFDGNSSGEIHKTLDGGNTWQNLNISTQEITAMHFISDTIGYFFNFNSELYKTVDGAMTWSLVNNNITGYITDALFFSETLGYTVSYEGSIYKTNDGGVTWNIDYSLTQSPLSSIVKTANNYLYVVGNNGIILKNEDIMSSIKDEIRDDVSIYPNPTNDYLIVDFKNMGNEYKTVEIYNQLGELLLQKSEISDNLTLKTGHLAKGLYLLKITTKSNTNFTKKIIIE